MNLTNPNGETITNRQAIESNTMLENNTLPIGLARLLPQSCVIIGTMPMLTQETINAYLWARNGKPRKGSLVYTIDGEKYLVTNHPSADKFAEYENTNETVFTARSVIAQTNYDYDGQ